MCKAPFALSCRPVISGLSQPLEGSPAAPLPHPDFLLVAPGDGARAVVHWRSSSLFAAQPSLHRRAHTQKSRIQLLGSFSRGSLAGLPPSGCSFERNNPASTDLHFVRAQACLLHLIVGRGADAV